MPFIWALLFAAAAPRVINHPPIPMKADAAAFAPVRTGCEGTFGQFSCAKGPLADLGCHNITADDRLGGLPLPTASCFTRLTSQTRPADNEYIRRVGALLPVYERYVVLDRGRYRLIKTMSEFWKTFQPVTSDAQAVSVAFAATTSYPVYGNKIDQKLRYHVSTIEDTYVTRERDDFIVHNLQHYSIFGCGPHSTYMVTVRVPRDGNASEISSIKAFEDPKQDGLCVD